MEDSEHIDLDTNAFNLIDFSENDNILFRVSPIAAKPKLSECWGDSQGFEIVGDAESGNVSRGNDEIDQLPEIGESEEPQRSRSQKCNLRKSLAWDKAFFTSAGVLDPEELTDMMDSGEAVQKKFLPGIQEEMQRSTDSISTLESDNFTLASLEAELFEDIRASIQKSSKSAKGSFGTKAILQGGDHDISSLKGDTLSPNQTVIKKINGLHKMGVPKCQPKVSTGNQGSTKAIKPESSHGVVPRSAGRIAELASSLDKPPKGTRKSSSATPSGTKVTSLGPSRLKTENSSVKTVSVRGSHASKMSSSNVPSRVLPKPVSTSQSSSRESMAKRHSTRSSPKGACSVSSLSEGEVKPPLATVRRKAPPKGVDSPSSRSTPQPFSKNVSKSKAISKNSAISAFLMSSKVPSSVSPASSVSEWSSTSSSSAVNQKSNQSRSSFGSSSCISFDGDALPLNLKTRADDQIPCRQEIKASAESIKKPSSQTGVISGSTSMKPTGLRMPTPKIGFFDGVKSVRASSGAMQSGVRLPLPSTKVGSGVSPKRIPNTKQKVSKLPPGRLLTARKHETENPDAPLAAKGIPQGSPRIGHHEKLVEIHVKVQENGSKEHDEASLKEHLGVTKNEMVFVENQDSCLKDVRLVDSESKDSKTNNCEPVYAYDRLDDLKIDGQHNLGNSLKSCCKIDEKENLPLEYRTDQSSKDEGVVKSDTVNLRTIEPLAVTCSEVE